MKPISELVILALTTRLRGALFLSYKTLTHFIISFLYPGKESNPQTPHPKCGGFANICLPEHNLLNAETKGFEPLELFRAL